MYIHYDLSFRNQRICGDCIVIDLPDDLLKRFYLVFDPVQP